MDSASLWPGSPDDRAIVTGMPLTAALPEITSTKVPGASTLLFTPAWSFATESRVPGRL
jgi:hypothetical protein